MSEYSSVTGSLVNECSMYNVHLTAQVFHRAQEVSILLLARAAMVFRFGKVSGNPDCIMD